MSDGTGFLADTYPDKYRHAKLYCVDAETGKVKLLADMKSPKKSCSPTTIKTGNTTCTHVAVRMERSSRPVRFTPEHAISAS
ncbi:MAG: hypothetical protein MRZ50_05140 [Prevotella sp.]|nr:hypothetical protein [Prevotella sp.]